MPYRIISKLVIMITNINIIFSNRCYWTILFNKALVTRSINLVFNLRCNNSDPLIDDTCMVLLSTIIKKMVDKNEHTLYTGICNILGYCKQVLILLINRTHRSSSKYLSSICSYLYSIYIIKYTHKLRTLIIF